MVYSFTNLKKKAQHINIPDSKVHGAIMGPTWVMSVPDGPHVGPMNLAIRDVYSVSQLLTKAMNQGMSRHSFAQRTTAKKTNKSHRKRVHRARFAPSQWETALLSDDVSHWLGANLESALHTYFMWHTVERTCTKRSNMCYLFEYFLFSASLIPTGLKYQEIVNTFYWLTI